MDSVTQLALGAAVGEALLGRRLGNRAIVWGAILGTVPDLDVLVPLADPVAVFTYHRSWSHSVFVLAALTLPMTWLARRLHADTRGPEWRWRWAIMIFAVFVTHVLLDCFTVFGTQVLWPIPRAPESWSTIFIIDPAYTVPLLVGVAGAWRRRRRGRGSVGARANAIGLVLSTAYLAWSVLAQAHVRARVEAYLADAAIEVERIHVSPTPLNTLLWRVIAVDADGYRIGYASVFDSDPDIAFRRYRRADDRLAPIADAWAVRRLAWFTHGFYSADVKGRELIVADLRMGSEPDYVFQFSVGEIEENSVRPIEPARRVAVEIPWRRLPWVWRRIWDPRAVE